MTENQAIRVLSAGAPKTGVRKCAETFADNTGQPFEIEFATAPVLKERVESGTADADLLVMGASGRGAVSSAVLGSVSNWLLHHVVTPMVVVPHAQQNAVRTDAR